MAKIGSLTADLKLESAAFIRDLKKAADATARNTSAMQRSMAGMQKSFAAAGSQLKTFIGGFVAWRSVTALATLGKDAVKLADDIGAAATKIGIGGEALQRFRFAAAQADVETEQLDNALRVFSQNLASGKIAAEGRNIEEAFRNVIERIAEAPTQLQKVAIAQEAFGKSWQSAILLAAQGAGEFNKQYAAAFVISQKALDQAGQLDNAFRDLTNAVQTGFATGFIESFSGGLNGIEADLIRLNSAAETFGRVSASAFSAAALGASALAKEIAENQKQTAAYIDTINKWREGQIGIGEMARGLMDPREAMRSNSGIQQSTDWWRQTMAGAKGAAQATGEATDALGKYADQVELAKMETDAFWKPIITVNRELMQARELALEFGQNVSASFANAIVEGEKFSVTLGNLLKDLAKMMLNQAFMSLIGSPTMAGGPAGSGLLGMFHGGGIVGKTATPMRLLPMAALDFAPRFHKGLTPGEFPAILQKGEGVFTRDQMAALGNVGPGGGAVSVTINMPVNAAGADPAAVARLSVELNKLKAELPTKIVQEVITARSRRML